MKPEFVLDYDTPPDAGFQEWLEALDGRLRDALRISENGAAAGVLDLQTRRVAMVRPDRIEYAASIAKIGILLAWFDAHPVAPDAQTAHELGLMVKASSNEMATKFSRALGLSAVQAVIDRHGFYDARRGGGLWVGRHYGRGGERHGDPVADHSHAVTVRQ
ncbi:MAG: hypothetical protein V4710_22495, partial [Verrucomicrobiota bacterium]